jgi:hypothetical protein
MDSTHIRWLEESLERNTVQKILQAENVRIEKDKESTTEKRNQRELLWFQTGGAFNFITAVPHCGDLRYFHNVNRYSVLLQGPKPSFGKKARDNSDRLL